MPRRFAVAAAVLALAGTLAAGCSKKITVTDPSYTLPEGQFSSGMELFTWQDQPNDKIRMKDRVTLGRVDISSIPANTDSIMLSVATGDPIITPVQRYTPGTTRGIVLNRTGAEGVEIYRTEPNGAVRRIFDFAIQPTRRWLETNTEVYEFYDSDPRRTTGATYYARGLVGGRGGANSPISNPSRATGTPVLDILYTATRWGTPTGQQPENADSTFFMAWQAVSGADRYLIHVFEYQTRAMTLRERILTGAPAPLLTSGVRDIFIASVPGSITQYRMGDPGATIYSYRTPHLRAEYFVRISAIDANGELIGMTRGPVIEETPDLVGIIGQNRDIRDWFSDFSDPEVAGSAPPQYLLYSRGAVRVSPGEPFAITAMRRTR